MCWPTQSTTPKRRDERAYDFRHKQRPWLQALGPRAERVLLALVERFADAGTEELENKQIWRTDTVRRAGGVAALQNPGIVPAALLSETKRRLFAA
jgi:hypothetical protein